MKLFNNKKNNIEKYLLYIKYKRKYNGCGWVI